VHRSTLMRRCARLHCLLACLLARLSQPLVLSTASFAPTKSSAMFLSVFVVFFSCFCFGVCNRSLSLPYHFLSKCLYKLFYRENAMFVLSSFSRLLVCASSVGPLCVLRVSSVRPCAVRVSVRLSIVRARPRPRSLSLHSLLLCCSSPVIVVAASAHLPATAATCALTCCGRGYSCWSDDARTYAHTHTWHAVARLEFVLYYSAPFVRIVSCRSSSRVVEWPHRPPPSRWTSADCMPAHVVPPHLALPTTTSLSFVFVLMLAKSLRLCS
jgi:hypothetical protein